MQLKSQQCIGMIISLLRKRYQNISVCLTTWRRDNCRRYDRRNDVTVTLCTDWNEDWPWR